LSRPLGNWAGRLVVRSSLPRLKERPREADTQAAHVRERDVVDRCVLVLGGATALAAHQLGKNTVGTKQLKKNAVTSAKVKNHSLKSADFKSGQLPAGPQGAQGAQGPKGDPGSAKAWAVVSHTGQVLKSFNVTGVSRFAEGEYCVAVANGISTANSAALATLDYSDPEVLISDQVVVSNGTEYNDCSPDSQFEVLTGDEEGYVKDDGFAFMVP
jgi:hypothetical protein